MGPTLFLAEHHPRSLNLEGRAGGGPKREVKERRKFGFESMTKKVNIGRIHNSMKCKNCGHAVERMPSELRKSKSGNAFCSRSCAAKFNNKKYPKRHKTNFCKCGVGLIPSAKYCGKCYRKKHYLEDKTLAEATANRTDNNRYTSIRQLSRKMYLQSDLPKCCLECGYDKHIEVCHIRDISDFPLTALVREINDLKNLVALCPNHHWEFDRGLIEIENGTVK